jgi:hypothetical protein
MIVGHDVIFRGAGGRKSDRQEDRGRVYGRGSNQEAMEPYRAAVGATIEQYDGRFLARAGATELIEGGPEPKRIVILDSPTKRRSSAGTIHPNTRKSCRAGSTIRPAAPLLSRA